MLSVKRRYGRLLWTVSNPLGWCEFVTLSPIGAIGPRIHCNIVKEQATVVYADILGFSNLVMSMKGAIGLLDGFYYSAMALSQLKQSFAEETVPDPLTRTFAAFHRTLDVRVSELVNADPLQSIVFPTPPSSSSAT